MKPSLEINSSHKYIDPNNPFWMPCIFQALGIYLDKDISGKNRQDSFA